jgi:hypothetical protein
MEKLSKKTKIDSENTKPTFKEIFGWRMVILGTIITFGSLVGMFSIANWLEEGGPLFIFFFMIACVGLSIFILGDHLLAKKEEEKIGWWWLGLFIFLIFLFLFLVVSIGAARFEGERMLLFLLICFWIFSPFLRKIFWKKI